MCHYITAKSLKLRTSSNKTAIFYSNGLHPKNDCTSNAHSNSLYCAIRIDRTHLFQFRKQYRECKKCDGVARGRFGGPNWRPNARGDHTVAPVQLSFLLSVFTNLIKNAIEHEVEPAWARRMLMWLPKHTEAPSKWPHRRKLERLFPSDCPNKVGFYPLHHFLTPSSLTATISERNLKASLKFWY